MADVSVKDEDAPFKPPLSDRVGDSEISLLAEWYDWWYTHQEEFGLPNMLHVRTSRRLTELGIMDPTQRAKT